VRNLKKNQRTLHYASYKGTEKIKDEYGNETLEVLPIYGEPHELSINYSSNIGEVATETFGNITNYSRVLSFVGCVCPLKEKDKLWIGIDTSLEANYEVIKVADSINSWLIAVGEIV
jgi:hypothetical protein